jgi:hypothetical protein
VPKRKAFFTRLPASTYLKLRKLAKLDSVEVTDDQVGILFRFHPETHKRLKKLALVRSLDGSEGTEMTMQSMLATLIDRAKAKDLQTREDMHDVVRQLIFAEEL